jgi:hypothetical protein
MHSFDRERLLTETLEDASYAAFRDETFELARRELRRKRRRAKPALWLALAASLALCAVLWPSRNVPPNPAPTVAIAIQPDQPASVVLVQTQPLPPVEVVRTFGNLSLVVETPRVTGNLQIVHTQPSFTLEITDAQLLALFSDRPAGFVHHPNGKEFILLE